MTFTYTILVNTYLFTKPVYILLKKNQSLRNNDDFVKMKRVAIKQWILSTVAVGTTIMAMILIILLGLQELFGTFDVFISTLAIIGMYDWNSWMTDYCFDCCFVCKKGTAKSKAEVNPSSPTMNTDEPNFKDAQSNEPKLDTMATSADIEIVTIDDMESTRL